MSDDDDSGEKSEAATDKRVRDAIEDGNVPVSRDASTLAALAAALLAAVFFIPHSCAELAGKLSQIVESAGRWRLGSGEAAVRICLIVIGEAMPLLGPIFILLAVCALAASVSQSPPRLAPKRIRPDWSRVSPGKGIARLAGRRGAIEFLKSSGKVFFLGATAAFSLQSDFSTIVDSGMREAGSVPHAILSILVRLLSAAAAAASLIAIADVLLVRRDWQRNLRMSRQDIKDEFRQSEGDPLVKARIRSVAMDRARRRMIANMPRATIVIANPTHFAIALRYMREEGGAPLVIAKGQDLLALTIRERAEALGIAVVENKPLARSMYERVSIDQMIPAEFYRAVAEILNVLATRARAF